MSANDHLVDSAIKLGTCNRCRAYVFLAHSSGIRAAADVAPADRDTYIAAVMDGRRLFDLAEEAGRPVRLLTRRLGSPAPLFDAEGVQQPYSVPLGSGERPRRKVLVEHGCGGHAQNMLRYEEVQQGPPSARVTPGSSHSGGDLQRAAHESGLTVEEIPRSPAVHVSPRPSKLPRCDICRKRVKGGELYWGIQRGNEWIYCEHEDCP